MKKTYPVLLLLSYNPIRSRLKYEKWHSFHLLMYLLVIPAFDHQLKNGNDFLDSQSLLYYWFGLYLFSLGNFVGYRFIKPLRAYSRHHFTIKKVEPESDDVTSLYIGGRVMEGFSYEPGDSCLH